MVQNWNDNINFSMNFNRPIIFRVELGIAWNWNMPSRGILMSLATVIWGYSNYSLTGYAALGLKPLLVYFSIEKRLISLFSHKFCKLGPISKESLLQNGWFFLFFIDRLLRFFWLKSDPCQRIFSEEKATHLGGTSPPAFTCDPWTWH